MLLTSSWRTGANTYALCALNRGGPAANKTKLDPLLRQAALALGFSKLFVQLSHAPRVDSAVVPRRPVGRAPGCCRPPLQIARFRSQLGVWAVFPGLRLCFSSNPAERSWATAGVGTTPHLSQADNKGGKGSSFPAF